MKRYIALGCAGLTCVSSCFPLATLPVMAKQESHAPAPHHAAPHPAPHPAAHHAAPHPAPHPPAHHAAPHPAPHPAAHPAPHKEAPKPTEKRPTEEKSGRPTERNAPRNEQNKSVEHKNEQQKQRNAQEQKERNAGEPKAEVKEERKQEEEQHKQQEKAQKEQEKAQKEKDKVLKEEEKTQEKEQRKEQKEESKPGETREHGGFAHAPGFKPRPSIPPVLRVPRVPVRQAWPVPFFHPHLNAQQREQAELAQRNMEHHLYAVKADHAPEGWQHYGPAQVNNYMNNYQTTINNRSIWINSGNTYCNPCPASGCPSWYQPTPGWGFTTGLMLGSISAGLNWLRWGWPGYFGAVPTGFMYQTSYVPTPWMYVPWANQWRQPGVMGYAAEGPPQDYTMPITVQVVEPVQTTMTDPATGETVPTTINQVIMYNAYYYPQFGRWGYMNRQGYFVWVDPNGGVPDTDL